MKKRGLFFEADAAIALFVLVIGALLIASYYFNTIPITPVQFLSDDLLAMFSTTKIKDLNNPYAGLGGELWQKGEISDPENTILQQIGEFYARGKINTSSRFIENVSVTVVPPQYDFEVWMNNKNLYPIKLSALHNSSRNSTNLLIVSKKVAYGILNKTTGDFWGPYKVEVLVWNAGAASLSYTTLWTACNNAETNGLCNGLDIVYGVGYKCACCFERELCCAGC